MSRMRTKPLGTLLGVLTLAATAVPAAAAVTAGDGFEMPGHERVDDGSQVE